MELPKRGLFSTVFSALPRQFIKFLDRGAQPVYGGSLTLAGLNRPVEVVWDRHAVPHVSAFDEQDLFFAQGYLHAQERLWQMEISRSFLSGRMAEIFGDFNLPWRELSSQFRGRTCADFDYFVRLIGIRAAAIESVNVLAEEDRLRLRSYCDGVNCYIERCGTRLPWEFRLLRHEPEPWRPEDTLTIGKGFGLLLSAALYSRLNFIAISAKLTGEPAKLRTLFPAYPEEAPITARAVWDDVRGLWEFSSGILTATDWHPAGNGSNSWAIAPERSATGRAILCNDPHLRLNLPSVWYLAHMKIANASSAPHAYEVWGASVPGIPYIQLGHNRHIAWGITAAICDDVDIYRERLHPLDPELYLVGERWQKLQIRKERIAIRGKRDIEKIVRLSRHGPAISDFNQRRTDGEILTARWTAQEASEELRSVYGINCARNWREFHDSLSYHSAPSLNFVYADREGNIGYALAGKIPHRSKTASLLPVAGWEQKNDWCGYIPFEALPKLYNPPQQAIASANNRITDNAYPYYLSQFFEPPPRIRRIEHLLGSRSKFSVEAMAQIQFDQVSLHALDLIAALRSELERIPDDNGTLKTAAARLLSWNGSCEETSVEAAIFHLFHHRLLINLLSPSLGEELCAAYTEILNQCIVPTDRILGDPHSIWFAGRSRFALVLSALREACGELEDKLGPDMGSWRWGKIHQLHMNHALGRLPVFKTLLGIGPIPTAGDGMTVNVGFYRHSNPYAQIVGPSLRCIVELGDSTRSEFILSSGQSGHPTSPHYSDQTPLWLNNQRLVLCTAAADRYLVLKPQSANLASHHSSG